MDFKEIYIAEMDRIAGELEEAGLSPEAAQDQAATAAYDAARDRVADMADLARQRAKDGAL